MSAYAKNRQYIKFCAYGFLKNLRFFDAFLLLFFIENGISFTQIGIIYAVRELVTNFSEIPSGIIADSYGRKKSLLASFFCYIISFLIFYSSSGFSFFIFAIFIYGIADSFRTGTHKGMIMDYLKLNNWDQHKVDYYGHTRSWSQLGSAISALIAGLLVLYFGNYRVVFLFAIFPYIINLINVASYPSDINYSLKTRSVLSGNSLVNTIKSFFLALKNPGVLQIINTTALHSAFLKAVKDYIQPVMIQVAILIPILIIEDEKRKSGLIIGIIYFFIYILTSIASRNSFRFSKLKIGDIPRITLLTGLIAGAICGVTFHFKYWIISLIAFVSIYLIENLRKPLLTGMISDSVPNEILTSVISAQSFYQTILTSLIALTLGMFADTLGIGISFIIISGLLLTLTLLIGVLKTPGYSGNI